ncbi:N-terminal nucleophile aminohydrolase [Gonapodya prolifera JEL478]|uniref:N-terminal nucleophile aminohydrolase n=1 Tax=Gonapodya prolifera (strain JEL478) TaxID=1344416 RepID=A0A139AT07_GONPJ|nr:N-terminal nucleophile aminohydrolase [Gonapodya prolifera JEL478]|eukprot:KXS19860.1 N-terminal nucleophile aminohydrolase [Gonapodya prolifera JEL478]
MDEEDAGLGDLVVFGAVKFFTQALIAPFHVAKILQQVNYIPCDDFVVRVQHRLESLPTQGDGDGDDDNSGSPADGADSSNGDASSTGDGDNVSELADSIYAQATAPAVVTGPGSAIVVDEQGYLVRTTFSLSDPVRPQYQLPPQDGSLFDTLSNIWRQPDEGLMSMWKGGVNTFSPEGRLFQVEYAIEAIKLGSTAIGLQTSEGVVLAVEKRVTSPLLEPRSIEKIVEIDSHIGTAMSGLTADARTMIDHARVEAQNHTFTYDERIKVESLTQAVCDLALRFGESADGQESIMSRPFGVALLIAGVDEKGPQLFHADPSGTFMQFDAKAIGSGSEGAQTELQEHYNKSMTLRDAEKLALKTLKQVMEEKLNSTNVQLASVVPVAGPQLGVFRIYSEKELEPIIAEL